MDVLRYRCRSSADVYVDVCLDLLELDRFKHVHVHLARTGPNDSRSICTGFIKVRLQVHVQVHLQLDSQMHLQAHLQVHLQARLQLHLQAHV